jgi:hypothetical protein
MYRVLIGSIGGLLLMQTSVAFTTIAKGSDSRLGQSREIVVRTQADWETLWKSHNSDPPPAVDFAGFMVVGVFLGSRPTGGYDVAITNVQSQNDTILVEYEERRPSRGDIVAQLVTAPFHLVRMSRDNGKVDFRKINR